MDGANADSDHSMTWEDFFGSTTDLTPTLIGIYDSLLEPAKCRPETNLLEKAKDARNDPPVKHQRIEDKMTGETKKGVNDIDSSKTPPKDPSRIAGSVKLPIATVNKSSLYAKRTVSENGASEGYCGLTSELLLKEKVRTIKDTKVTEATFDNLSPNVKRMISGATETTGLKFQKKTATIGRASVRHKTNIPLVGATSKISQSGVEILPSVEIYDQPCGMKTFGRSKADDNESPSKCTVPITPNFKVNEEQTTYDVPTNNRPVLYDVPNSVNKTAFESLSLPYIDQSIELSVTSNDREFDIKLSPKENSPLKFVNKTTEESPGKISKSITGGTNSLQSKDYVDLTLTNQKQLANSELYHEVKESTGNLKSCAIPEKERMNPPLLEVTRPLSMSSIASSSSTSSSGVQNKGGVNSAYLASIESLDDHSDADMTSANGSNNFVNNAGVLNNGASEQRHSEDISGEPDCTSELSQLERVCAEIVQTENVYVEDLRQVVEGYLHEWRRETTFSEDELSELFNNIEDIFTFNRSLCAELNSCRLDATCIARCFVDNTTGFSVYTSYCTGYPRTMERLAALASDTHSARQFRERQVALGHPLPLASYLLKPVQRILKYHLLLQNVVKQCASRETEYALLKMTSIAQHIDDMKRRHEHAVRVQEIQSLLYGWNGPDLTTYGELCAEGTFRVFGAKAMRHAFLFDKMLLITKNREDGILAYKSHIMCNNMMLVESIAGAPLSFHVIPWDAPRAQLTLQARSQRHKREWTLLLKRVILENYNAVIPSHARQLVMELGQNKTDDDMLAEKSHNLITQASMRKQLSAPEYLEKRKLERDRRKSFENGVRGRFKKANRKYTLPISRRESQDCGCVQLSTEKGTDYTCDNCYIDLCSDCETELNKEKTKDDKCVCKNDENEYTGSKCNDCEKRLEYIDAGSAENIEKRTVDCKCSDFISSQESFGKEFTLNSLNKTRGYHSSDNIINYANKSKEDLTDNNVGNDRNVPKTCLKCAKIKENIVYVESVNNLHSRKSRCNDIIEKSKSDTLRSKSKEDPNRSKLSKIGTWRRKSEPGLQQNSPSIIKKSQDSDNEKSEVKGSEKIKFECRNCGSNKITKKVKINEAILISDLDSDAKSCGMNITKPNIEIKMYNTKHIPKKISKIKKNRAKGLRLGSDTTAKFYADLSTDVSTENILHISESNDSLNIDKSKDDIDTLISTVLSKDEDIDEETYKKLIEKTDSFKKNELEKVKYLNKQKVINEGSEVEEKNEVERQGDVLESCEEGEQPLELIISQLLMQNREFQKLLKKQQQRNSAQRRHQRLLKSNSTPEQVIIGRNSELTKLKPKYGRQTSETFDCNTNNDISNTNTPGSVDQTDDDHIYETLRVDGREDESLHSLDVKSKSIQHNSHISRPKRIPSPLDHTKNTPKDNLLESDYVYLSFDQVKNEQTNEQIYDVPSKYPLRVGEETTIDCYVTMENNGPPTAHVDNLYDNLTEVCRRKKENSDPSVSDYLPMCVDQSPNTPEIWLSRQKEHFNVSSDRKSGSLPRSFQVPVTNNPEETNLTSFKFKPNSNSKTYLNRDGKVMNSDRPYTIASDKSEISFDDVENYMGENDILKFNKSTISSDIDHAQNISQSTLELEEEIDRCYKNNFEEVKLDKNKNNDELTVSQPNLNTSTASSCEVLPIDQDENKPKDIEIIHPEHKIYKPTSNMLSLKNVLNRFKNRNPNKNVDETEINANDQINSDIKTDLKSPTTEKRAALNPRNYSKNLLQRFKSIISDEHADNNQNRSELSNTKKIKDDSENSKTNNDVQANITATTSSVTSSIAHSIHNDVLSKSVCENTTITESQKAKNNLEELSYSCDNLPQKPEIFRPFYTKSSSLTSNTLTTTGSISSPIKSNNSSYQSLNKLPIYMQGSKHLGARIAQSDYVDPTTLTTEKSTLKLVNVLINKNSIRPDSLFSNSSFVTSSSEGTYQEGHNKGNPINTAEPKDITKQPTTSQFISDESFYEKSFEEIEHIKDVEVFRDSAVYSDQEEGDEIKTNSERLASLKKPVNRVSSVKCTAVSAQKVTITSRTCEKVSLNQNNLINKTTFQTTKNSDNICQNTQKTIKTKIAPPVPMKPKISSIHTTQHKITNRPNLLKTEQSSPPEKINPKTSSSNMMYKQTFSRSESAPIDTKPKILVAKTSKSEEETLNTEEVETNHSKPQGNIQMKRLSFERASLDSATRKLKTTDKRLSMEPSKTSKSVMERRMELEQLTKSQKPNTLKKPTQNTRLKSITMKVATFERSASENGKRDERVAPGCPEKANIPQKTSVTDDKTETNPEVDAKGSWVKQVVNKFQ